MMKLKIEVVVWDDAFSHGWTCLEDLKERETANCPLVSVGILALETKDWLVLAQTQNVNKGIDAQNPQTNDNIFIPKSLIRERKSISVNIKEEE